MKNEITEFLVGVISALKGRGKKSDGRAIVAVTFAVLAYMGLELLGSSVLGYSFLVMWLLVALGLFLMWYKP